MLENIFDGLIFALSFSVLTGQQLYSDPCSISIVLGVLTFKGPMKDDIFGGVAWTFAFKLNSIVVHNLFIEASMSR